MPFEEIRIWRIKHMGDRYWLINVDHLEDGLGFTPSDFRPILSLKCHIWIILDGNFYDKFVEIARSRCPSEASVVFLGEHHSAKQFNRSHWKSYGTGYKQQFEIAQGALRAALIDRSRRRDRFETKIMEPARMIMFLALVGWMIFIGILILLVIANIAFQGNIGFIEPEDVWRI